MSQLNVVLPKKADRNNLVATPVIVDLTRRVFNKQFSTALPGGFMSATLSVSMRKSEAYEWYERYLFYGIEIFEAGQPVWEGRINSIALRDYGIDVTCEGYWSSLADVRLHSFWSDNDMSKWRLPQMGTGAFADEITLSQNNDKHLMQLSDHYIVIGTKDGMTYNDEDRAIYFYRLPRFDLLTDDSIFQPQTIHGLMYEFDVD